MKEIKDYREEIRNIDDEMARLFTRRMDAVKGVAEYKRSHGLSIEDPAVEQLKIDLHSSLIEDPELKPYYIQFLQDTMKVSRRFQHKLMYGQRVAYCPVHDDTGLQAVQTLFPEADLNEFESYADAYRSVADGDCDIAVLPFEVSYRGEVGQVLDLMFAGDLYVNDVYDLKADSETTRYAVLSKVEKKTSDAGTGNVFMLMFTVKDETGGHAEAIGNDASENGKRMLNALKVACPSVKIVGRYSI